MVYNIPVFTQFDITPEIFACFSEIEGVDYIKDSTANPVRISRMPVPPLSADEMKQVEEAVAAFAA